MASSSSRDGPVPDTGLATMSSDQKNAGSLKSSNEPIQTNKRVTINEYQRLLLARLCGGRSRRRIAPDFKPVDSYKPNPGPATSPIVPTCSGALPFIPEIRVKSADARDARTDTGGSVSPSRHAQSTDHLQVPGRPNARTQHRRRPVDSRSGPKKTFWGYVDRALGLYRVRTFGDDEALVGNRYRAKRNTYRVIALFGVLMMLNFGASIACFVYFASKGDAGPEWFAWIGASAGGWVWFFLAFIMVKRSKRQALHDVEIARQSIRLNSRVRNGTAAPVAIIGGPSANRQQVMRTGSSTAGDAAPAVIGLHPGLEAIQEEDWARDAEERLDMLVATQRSQGGDV